MWGICDILVQENADGLIIMLAARPNVQLLPCQYLLMTATTQEQPCFDKRLSISLPCRRPPPILIGVATLSRCCMKRAAIPAGYVVLLPRLCAVVSEIGSIKVILRVEDEPRRRGHVTGAEWLGSWRVCEYAYVLLLRGWTPLLSYGCPSFFDAK